MIFLSVPKVNETYDTSEQSESDQTGYFAESRRAVTNSGLIRTRLN